MDQLSPSATGSIPTATDCMNPYKQHSVLMTPGTGVSTGKVVSGAGPKRDSEDPNGLSGKKVPDQAWTRIPGHPPGARPRRGARLWASGGWAQSELTTKCACRVVSLWVVRLSGLRWVVCQTWTRQA